jgi:DNA polymerase alpha/epsilon subunit B
LIFQGYLEDGVVPTAIVLMGSFLSHPFGQRSNDPSVLTSAFAELGRMIATDFPRIAESSTFVIVPGPNDAGPGNVLPRPPMPHILTSGFVAALSERSVMLATNPCRLRYLTQEFVFFREDLLHKMLRHCAVKPDLTDTGHMAEHMVKSIIDQAHLCPLPLPSRPILWAHDHAMWLFPSPHLVVVSDKVDGYAFKYGETIGMNPGSFAGDLSFAIYLPAECRSQQCTLNPEQLATHDDERSDGGADSADVGDNAADEDLDVDEDIDEHADEDADSDLDGDEEGGKGKDKDEGGVTNGDGMLGNANGGIPSRLADIGLQNDQNDRMNGS